MWRLIGFVLARGFSTLASAQSLECRSADQLVHFSIQVIRPSNGTRSVEAGLYSYGQTSPGVFAFAANGECDPGENCQDQAILTVDTNVKPVVARYLVVGGSAVSLICE